MKFQQTIANYSPRGGATIINMEDVIVIFGGADREQCHFGDVAICRRPEDLKDPPTWERYETTGDVPTSRSGHAVCRYGKYMFLYGGIDYSEEVAYNDLYVLNTDTLVWKYVGEKGEEILARNSHSLQVITSHSKDGMEKVSCLVLYGGASPEQGPLDDTYFAMLPTFADLLDSTEFYVTWKQLLTDDGAITPGAREMHASNTLNQSLVISGGRNAEGHMFGDVWVLESEYVVQDETPPEVNIKWKKMPFQLPTGRCAHGLTVLQNRWLCLFGGFTADARVSNEFLVLDVAPKAINDIPTNVFRATKANEIETPMVATSVVAASSSWRTTANEDIQERFGSAVCDAPVWYKEWRELASVQNKDNKTSTTTATTRVPGVLVFGGVNAVQDFGDVWYADVVPAV